jgi:hypothetical protein
LAIQAGVALLVVPEAAAVNTFVTAQALMKRTNQHRQSVAVSANGWNQGNSNRGMVKHRRRAQIDNDNVVIHTLSEYPIMRSPYEAVMKLTVMKNHVLNWLQ